MLERKILKLGTILEMKYLLEDSTKIIEPRWVGELIHLFKNDDGKFIQQTKTRLLEKLSLKQKQSLK